MKEYPLYTVVIAHFNQLNYIFQAIDSVLMQTYPNIEILIADDASFNFDIQEVKVYIEKHKKENIKKIVVYSNENNLGTIKNLNKTIEVASGFYFHFFAADDALYDAFVVENFAKELEELNPADLCVSGQSMMMDENLEKEYGDFTDVEIATALNGKSALDQFLVIQRGTFYATGASAFLRNSFFTHEKFDEQYKLIEDWPYFLSQTRKGRKVKFVNFYALRHRDGGISSAVNIVEGKNAKRYNEDILRIYEQEILPFLKEQPLQKQVEFLAEYDNQRESFRKKHGVIDRPSRFFIVMQNKGLYLRKCFWWYYEKKGTLFIKSGKTFGFIMLTWFLLVSLAPFFINNLAILHMPVVQVTIIEKIAAQLIKTLFLMGILSGTIFLLNTVLICLYGLKKLLQKEK